MLLPTHNIKTNVIMVEYDAIRQNTIFRIYGLHPANARG